MNRSKFFQIVLALVIFCVAGVSSAANNKTVAGVWKYTSDDLPIEYAKGTITITKKSNKYKCTINVNDNMLLYPDEIKVSGNKINISVSVDGEYVNAELKVVKNTFSGKVSVGYEEFTMEGKKSVKK